MSMRSVMGYPVFEPGHENPESCGYGYEGRDYSKYPLNGQAHNKANDIVALSDKELRELIKQKDNDHSWITDLTDHVNHPCKNQKQQNFCWGNAPCYGMEACLIATGAPSKVLSAPLPCDEITHGQNVGGSGVVWVNHVVEHGTCIDSMCPTGTLHPNMTAELKANRLLHKIELTTEIDPLDLQLLMTRVALDKPTSVGIPAASHEMIVVRLLVDEKGKIWMMPRQTWGGEWGGHNGYCLLGDPYTRFDEAISVESVTQAAA